jgi:hypothetical protein
MWGEVRLDCGSFHSCFNWPRQLFGRELITAEDMHPTARDFGSLIPYIKSYSRNLIPDIDPGERVAKTSLDSSQINITKYPSWNDGTWRSDIHPISIDPSCAHPTARP